VLLLNLTVLGLGSLGPRERGTAEVRTLDDAIVVLEQLVAAAQRWGFPDRNLFGIRLSLEEAIINGVRHGNKLDPTKVVYVRYSLDAEALEVEIEDQGPGFDPEAVPDPTSDDGLGVPSGRGLLLMRHFMTEVCYHAPGNRVRLRCNRGS
jgi:serine/threonine-protein kinase RsbW